MISKKKPNFIKILLTGQNKEKKGIVMTTIEIGIELKMINNKNAFVGRTYLVLNGFNAAMKISVEDPIGITWNVLDLIPKI